MGFCSSVGGFFYGCVHGVFSKGNPKKGNQITAKKKEATLVEQGCSKGWLVVLGLTAL